VYSRGLKAYPARRNGRFPVELTGLMHRLRRRNARKVAKLARALASLDAHAREARPAPRRIARVSLG